MIDVPPERRCAARAGCSRARMFVVDTAEGRIVDDDEVKRDIAGRFPYRKWLEQERVRPSRSSRAAPAAGATRGRRAVRGCSAPSATPTRTCELLARADGRDRQGAGRLDGHRHAAGGAVAISAPSLFAYFHQLFAQVTNPPIDPIREALVMTLETTLGPDGNTFDETPEQCHQLRAAGPDPRPTRDLAKLAAHPRRGRVRAARAVDCSTRSPTAARTRSSDGGRAAVRRGRRGGRRRATTS